MTDPEIEDNRRGWTVDPMFEETISRLFAKHCPSNVAKDAERSGFPTALWDVCVEAGLPGISVPESSGGSGSVLGDAVAMLRIAGRYAAPIPLAETAVLARWLLSTTDLGSSDSSSPLTVAVRDSNDVIELDRESDGWRVTARLHRVPWASQSEAVVVIAETPGLSALFHVVYVPTALATIVEGRNLAGEPRDLVTVDEQILSPDYVFPAPVGVDLRTFELRGALARSALMAGAMDRIAEITVAYARERHQFGRSIASFQAVQQNLVRLSAEAAGAGLAVDVATAASAVNVAPFEIAVAKTAANAASGVVTRLAHQVHGAIGMTQEYELQLYTRRLWSWRAEFGTERYWNSWLGEITITAGADRLWPRIATGLVEVGN